MHVAYQGFGDEAGAEGAAVAVESWVSIQIERQKRAGEAGHRAAAVSDGNIRERVLLAWTPAALRADVWCKRYEVGRTAKQK